MIILDHNTLPTHSLGLLFVFFSAEWPRSKPLPRSIITTNQPTVDNNGDMDGRRSHISSGKLGRACRNAAGGRSVGWSDAGERKEVVSYLIPFGVVGSVFGVVVFFRCDPYTIA